MKYEMRVNKMFMRNGNNTFFFFFYHALFFWDGLKGLGYKKLSLVPLSLKLITQKNNKK